ncbi:hypothetical protein PAT3040_02673 [Paenibacillus agaridevorans]|uniref:TraG P-loop domain-containing protein n=1 Tax=Paenibacillus agaridevorans TaxID=171404 RepID=A0A2R5EN41_9BACL|nr:DUF87 domain-containing protein [Paenibacillus agaridevorans]GBG08106.1 hypothetical protein PAT3040_02673 [Paenibacillus agaridevorans]
MIANAQRLIKTWKKAVKHLEINGSLDGKDVKNGHYVRVVTIKGYPPMLLAGYLDTLDKMVSEEGATLRKTIRYAKSKAKWGWSLKNKLRRLERSMETAQEAGDPERRAETAARDTILALRDAAYKDERTLVDIHTFLTLSAPKKHQLDAATKKLQSWFDDVMGELDLLEREQVEAMKQTSPVCDPNTKTGLFFQKQHYGRVTTDIVAAKTYPFTRGSFSDNKGLYFGRRTEDGGFCFIDICNPDDPRAQNLTVFGKTGQGKSFFMKALVVSLVEEGIHVFVFDLDGEWRDLCEYIGGVYVDHTAGTGRYYEPLTIMPALPELDADCAEFNRSRLQKAIDAGIRTLSLLAKGLTDVQTFEAGEAIKRVLASAGIDVAQEETWMGPYAGPRPTIHLVFEDIQREAERNADAKGLFDKIKIYFIGIYNGLFAIEEPLEFQRAKLVVYKVGSGQMKDSDASDERAQQAQLKMSMAIDAVNANIQYLKFQGAYFSAVLVDEGQRQTQNPHLRSEIFNWYTAIRKWNGMMILGSNTPMIMLDTAEGIGMWENTNTRVYFYMEHSAVRELARHSDIPLEVQQRISENEDTNRYVLEYNKKYDELLMQVPEQEARQYKTRGLKQTG